VSFPGELITAAGAPVHVVVDGDPGDPRVLLTAGLGGAWFDWLPTVDLLRDTHRVINFDRPGLGGSPGRWTAPTLRDEAARLAALARWARPPVIIVAHSYGAFHAEALARTEPELVAGLVLVDPSCEGDARVAVRLTPLLTPVARATGAIAGAIGAAWLLGPLSRRLVMRRLSRRDPAPPDAVRAAYGRGTVVGTALAENVAYGEMVADLAELRRSRPFPEIPLTVLTAIGDVRSAERRRGWVECHRRLAAMSPYGRQVTLDDALHHVQTDRPEVVAAAVAEIGSRT
jgi:pimeloyl-ACP methyl ester carboxylesterase